MRAKECAFDAMERMVMAKVLEERNYTLHPETFESATFGNIAMRENCFGPLRMEAQEQACWNSRVY